MVAHARIVRTCHVGAAGDEEIYRNVLVELAVAKEALLGEDPECAEHWRATQ